MGDKLQGLVDLARRAAERLSGNRKVREPQEFQRTTPPGGPSADPDGAPHGTPYIDLDEQATDDDESAPDSIYNALPRKLESVSTTFGESLKSRYPEATARASETYERAKASLEQKVEVAKSSPFLEGVAKHSYPDSVGERLMGKEAWEDMSSRVAMREASTPAGRELEYKKMKIRELERIKAQMERNAARDAEEAGKRVVEAARKK